MSAEFFMIEKAVDDRKTDPIPIKSTRGQLFPMHQFQASIDLVTKNIYAKRCLDELYKSTVGKGLDIAPDEWRAMLNQDFLERIDKDYLKTGNAFIEVVVLSGKIIALYHVPVLTMNKYTKDGKYTYKQPAVKNGKEYDPYAGQTKTGNYILHIMDYEDDQHYGCPFWLGAEYKIEQSTNSDIYNSNFFKNDCKPEGVILGTGLNLSEDEKKLFREHLQSSYKGVSNSRKKMVSMSDTVGGKLEYVAFGESVIDMSFINLLRENKTDICAAFRVPPKLVGLETPGRLGGGNDFAVQANLFYENEIIPRQVYYEELFSAMAGSEIKFVRPKLIESTEVMPAEDAEVQKEAKTELVDILKIIADKLA